MGYMSEFLHQEVPKTGKTMPAYYHRALLVSEAILACYFVISIIVILLTIGKLEWPPILVLILLPPMYLIILILGFPRIMIFSSTALYVPGTIPLPCGET